MGYYTQPNMLDIPGEDLPHVTHFYKEAHAYYRQRVVIVGGKNSAAEAALEIHRAGGHVTMVHRGAAFGESIKYWVKPDIENRVKEGSIAAHFNATVKEIRPSEVILDSGVAIPAEAVLLLTGYRADPEFMRRIGVTIDADTLEPHYSAETYETNVPGLFVAGGQVAGRKTGTVFIENGRFHGEVIAKTLAARQQQS
jgi:thioredoxin reductase (NADPH)